MMYSRYFPGLQGIFVIFFWAVIWVLKIRRLLGYPKNHLKSMKIRWSINVFACFPMFSQATQHFFHGRWKITLLWPRYRHQRKYWADDARLQEKPGLKRLFLSEEPECQCVYLIWFFFFEIALNEMRFWRKSHRSSSDFAVFVHVFPATSGMTLFSKEEARADHGQGMAAGTNQGWSQPGPSEPHPQCYFNRNMMNWLVVWNMAFMTFPSYWECHHPNWRSHIFQRGRYTTNQWNMIRISGWVSMVFDSLFTHVWRGPGTGLAYFGVVCGWIRETRSDLNA